MYVENMNYSLTLTHIVPYDIMELLEGRKSHEVRRKPRYLVQRSVAPWPCDRDGSDGWTGSHRGWACVHWNRNGYLSWISEWYCRANNDRTPRMAWACLRWDGSLMAHTSGRSLWAAANELSLMRTTRKTRQRCVDYVKIVLSCNYWLTDILFYGIIYL